MFRIGVNAFLIDNGKVLLGKRLSKVGFNSWGLPGGHLEQGEDFVVGVKREVLEETGLSVEQVDFLQLINAPRQDEHYIQINFLVKKWSGLPEVREPLKCAEWKWFDLENLPENIFFGHAEFFKALKNNITFIS